jgi:hypothetical protein
MLLDKRAIGPGAFTNEGLHATNRDAERQRHRLDQLAREHTEQALEIAVGLGVLVGARKTGGKLVSAAVGSPHAG